MRRNEPVKWNRSIIRNTEEVWTPALPLWDVEHVLSGRFVQFASVNGPQSAQNAEKRAFPAAVRAGDEKVHAFLYLQRQGRSDNIKIGRNDGHVIQRNDAVGELRHFAASNRDAIGHFQPQRFPLALRWFGIAVDGWLLVFTLCNLFEHVQHIADARGVASQFDNFLRKKSEICRFLPF